MLLYEWLMAHRGHATPERAALYALLEQAIVVRVDNVARYYFDENPQEEWDLTEDFPNVAPPWPVAFYEFAVPRYINSEGMRRPNDIAGWHQGVLLTARSSEEALRGMPLLEQAQRTAWITAVVRCREEHGQGVAEQVQAAGPEAVWGAIPPEVQADWLAQIKRQAAQMQSGEVGWLCEAVEFVATPRLERVVQNANYAFPVTPEGRFLRLSNGKLAVTVSYSTAELFERMSQASREGSLNALHIPSLAISFAHCRNVRIVEVVPPERLARKQARRGVPKVTYRELVIDPMREVLRREGGSDRHGLARALHICRGHFKQFSPERPLFGKQAGTFWWPMHVRGSGQQGLVVKNYGVDAPPTEAAHDPD